MKSKASDTASPSPKAARIARATWRELILPILVAIGLVAIAVSLIEGPPAGDFLYAVF